MWLIGMLVCATVMPAGHAAVNAGHGSHSHADDGGPALSMVGLRRERYDSPSMTRS